MNPHDETDEDLVRRFAEGDGLAFDELVLRHRDAVYRFVRSQLDTDRNEAEDVTQSVFVEVFRCLDRFEGRSRLRTWIVGIAANLCRQRRRERSSEAGHVEIVEAEALRQLPDGSPGLVAALERRELQEAVRAAIDGLGPEQRTVVLLREIEGLSYAEIAEALHVPLGTVRSRLHNARASLAERLMAFARSEAR